MSAPYRLVDTRLELERAVERWMRLPELALDTEFVHETTFWPRPGLVQVAAGDEIALVDAVEVRDLAPLRPLIESRETLKIVHAGSGDAALLERAAGSRPTPLFDTQVAAAFCGLGTSLSYAALVRELTGVELAKSETRTNWTRRPLSSEQLTYAADDVLHLPHVASLLAQRLDQLGRRSWVEEESLAASSADPSREDPELAWTRLRGIERFSAASRRVVAALASWRETEARRRDLPRTFVLRDESLREIARRQLVDPEALVKVRGFDARRHGRFAAAVTEIVAAAIAESGGIPAANPTPVPRELDRAVAEVVTAVAAELGLPAELVLSRRSRERLLAALRPGESPSSRLDGWRKGQLGAALDAIPGFPIPG